MAELALSLSWEVQEFLNLVNQSGRPQDWRLIVTSPPPKDSVFEVVARFSVPFGLRKMVEMVPCSICRPNNPKFWDGYLVWFPLECRYRLIGHRCGELHFGARFGDQVKKLESRERDARAADYLLDNLPNVSLLISIAEGLVVRNGELDRLRTDLVKKTTKSLVSRLVREGAGGTLTVAEHRLVTAVGADGREVQKPETIPVATYPIRGLDFLRDQRSGVSRAANGLKALREFPETDDDIEKIVLYWNQTLGECANAKDRFIYAVQELQDAIKFLRRATAFFSKENFGSLRDWTAYPGCPLVLRAGVDAYGRLNMSVPGRSHFRCEMRPCITDPIPSLPEIDAD